MAVGTMSEQIDERYAARGLSPAESSTDVAFERSVIYDQTPAGELIITATWAITDSTARPPFGVPLDFTYDHWYVSPALAKLTRTDPVLAARFGAVSPLLQEVVAEPDEYLAYRIVPTGNGFSEQLSRRPGLSGLSDYERIEELPILLAAALFLAIPGVGLLIAAGSAPRVKLEARLAILRTLGATYNTRIRLVAASSILTLLPGAAVGAAAWAIVGPLLTRFPLTDVQVLKGDLALPVRVLVVTALGLTALYAVILSGMTMSRGVSANTPRRSRRRHVNPSLMPLALGLLGILSSQFVEGRRGATWLVASILTSVVGLIVGLPVVYQLIGRYFGNQSGWKILLIGRRLDYASQHQAKALASWCAFIVLYPLVAGWVATARAPDPVGESAITTIQLVGNISEEVRQEAESVAGAPSAYISVENLSPSFDGTVTPEVRLIGDCVELRVVLDIQKCDRTGFILGPESLNTIGGRVSVEGSGDLLPNYSIASLLFFSRDGSSLETNLRKFALARPGFSVISRLSLAQRESPLVVWVIAAMKAMAVTASIALALALAGHSARLAVTRRVLLTLGAERAQVSVLAAAEAAMVVLVAAAGAFFLALIGLIAIRGVDPSAIFPTSALITVSGICIVGSLLAGLCSGVVAWDRPN